MKDSLSVVLVFILLAFPPTFHVHLQSHISSAHTAKVMYSTNISSNRETSTLCSIRHVTFPHQNITSTHGICTIHWNKSFIIYSYLLRNSISWILLYLTVCCYGNSKLRNCWASICIDVTFYVQGRISNTPNHEVGGLINSFHN